MLLVLGVATHLLLLLGTRHSAHRTVPDLTGIPLEEALGEARRQGLEIIVNDSLYVPAYDGGVVLDQLPEKGRRGSNPDERSMSRSTPTDRRW